MNVFDWILIGIGVVVVAILVGTYLMSRNPEDWE